MPTKAVAARGGCGLTRTARSARLRRLTSFGGYPTAAVCPPSRARRPAVTLVVARCAAMPRRLTTASQSSFAASEASHRRAPCKLPRSNKPFERGRFSPRARHPDRQRATDRVPKRGQLREARTRQNCLALARRLAPPTGSARGASATLANARRISPRASATVRVAAAWSSTTLVNRDYQRSTVASAAVFLFLFGLRGSCLI